jgi:4-diphosphocytidyl-2-C-methyl-D-erythritol kinase
MATRVRSYSKINLGLAIGPAREDGFHGLATLYQTLALHDVVTVSAKPTSQNRDPYDRLRAGSGQVVGHPGIGETRISLTTNHPQVPTDARNTAWKMVELALARMGVAAEVAIHLEKELPVQGGLGAGSANAAAALLGLERELGLRLPEAERMELAAEVGSDVPLFLVGGAVLGTGRGERVSGVADLPATPCVIAVPEAGVSTPRAFRDWDEKQGSGSRAQGSEGSSLTDGPQPDRLEELSLAYASVLKASVIETAVQAGTSGIVRGLAASPEKKQAGSGDKPLGQGGTLNGLAENTLLELVRTGIENDFEQVVFPQYPLLREIKHELMGTSADPAGSRDGQAIYAALSGSGSALFGLYRSAADARAAQQRVQASGCKAILTETLPRQEYWRTMFAE